MANKEINTINSQQVFNHNHPKRFKDIRNIQLLCINFQVFLRFLLILLREVDFLLGSLEGFGRILKANLIFFHLRSVSRVNFHENLQKSWV